LAKKVIEWELTDKNMAALYADLDTTKEINKRQGKELMDLKRTANMLKIEGEALKHDKESLEEYLRSMKNKAKVSYAKPSNLVPNYASINVGKLSPKKSRLELIDGETGNKTTYG
jgi:FtsZ-binding cell division protein ZapB